MLWRSPYGIATLHAKSLQSAPFEMVEIDRIVGERAIAYALKRPIFD
ncbi:MAG: hypothetical protein JGK15_13675 [Microcoleus sp. PH2017_33_LGB_O_A]|nr:hypothetical protein [Microcoleus sp. PH2017_33_LGB_O_A]MCC3641700.1 hypothetical protein [Microcoleus sp. PH2017_33_LGB_O_A]